MTTVLGLCIACGERTVDSVVETDPDKLALVEEFDELVCAWARTCAPATGEGCGADAGACLDIDLAQQCLDTTESWHCDSGGVILPSLCSTFYCASK